MRFCVSASAVRNSSRNPDATRWPAGEWIWEFWGNHLKKFFQMRKDDVLHLPCAGNWLWALQVGRSFYFFKKKYFWYQMLFLQFSYLISFWKLITKQVQFFLCKRTGISSETVTERMLWISILPPIFNKNRLCDLVFQSTGKKPERKIVLGRIDCTAKSTCL